MKSIHFVVFYFVVLSFVTAQHDPEALTALDAMSSKYKQMDNFSAQFEQTLSNEMAGINESLSGKIHVKGEKYVLEIQDLKIFNDGKNIYSYNAPAKEVTITSFDPTEDEINIANIYDIYKEGFKYVLLSSLPNGSKVVDLSPEDKEKSFFKIRMTISPKDKLQNFTIFEQSGNKFLYKIKELSNQSLGDDFFTFSESVYPEVEVIDFR